MSIDDAQDTRGKGPSPSLGRGPPAGRRSDAVTPESARSGDFSRDPALDPEQLFRVISGEENAERVSQAMRAFLTNHDVPRFEQAVAVFVRSACARGEPVERVLAVLIEFAAAREGAALPARLDAHRSPPRRASGRAARLLRRHLRIPARAGSRAP